MAAERTVLSLERLRREVLLLDGGLGSQLIALGLVQGQAPEHWNLLHPDRVAAVHRGYVEAGSDVIHANTFGASGPKLRSVGLAGRCEEINAAAVQIAREACGTSSLVAGDMGPTGLLLPPVGSASEAELLEAFQEQAEALARAGADLISLETLFDLREALAAVRAAMSTGLPVLASMTFEARRRGFFTIMGDRIGPSLRALAGAGALAVGFNCSVTSDVMVAMVAEAAQEVESPIVAQPNAGLPTLDAGGRVRYDADPLSFAADLARMVRAGARAVGGCCGTNPSFIRAARQAIAALDGA